ncbi:MAG TPA: hypothetical protein EYH07_05460 [Kiloniellaceae bacterium]|nr:hypothetical protein [Kiloniellaceae bacterium]
MKAFFVYSTHDHETWVVYKDEDAPEAPEEAVSPSGEEAFLMRKEMPSDICSIEFIAANRIIDEATGTESHKDLYHLRVSNPDGSFERVSQLAYSWETAVKLGAFFRNASPKAAGRIWHSKRLGNAVLDKEDPYKRLSSDDCSTFEVDP